MTASACVGQFNARSRSLLTGIDIDMGTTGSRLNIESDDDRLNESSVSRPSAAPSKSAFRME